MVDIQANAVRILANEITRSGGIARPIVADVSDPKACGLAVEEIVEVLGPPDILVNHAGTVIVKSFLNTSTTDWRRLIDINIMSMVEMCRLTLPHMLKKGGGAIVNTSSISGLTASALEIAYCVTKGAVIQLTRGLAVEFRERGIRCNAVCPGFIRTDHGLREMRELVALGEPVTDADIALLQGRMCEPDEVAQVIAFLASDSASFVNGEMLVVDNAALAKT
jgi:NAD(P)-dependent dehydrogenase (short-subunit alcohol dehydrogenase family)